MNASGIWIYNGSVLDILDRVAPHVHTAISDPPYRANVHAKATSQSAQGGTRERDLGFSSLRRPLRSAIARACSLVQRWSLIYSDVESSNIWRHAVLAYGGKTKHRNTDHTELVEYVRTIPWLRWSMPQLGGDRPTTSWELITLYARPGKKRWNGPGNQLALEHTCLRGDDKHKSEKPLDQALDLVSWYSDPGELVADWTAGSFTTALACRILGRRFVGAELSTEWCRYGHDRVHSKLSERDAERVERYVRSAGAEIFATINAPATTAGGHRRAQVRLADAQRATAYLRAAA